MNITKKITASFGTALFLVNNALAQFETEPIDITGAAKGTLGQNINTMINYFLGLLGLIAVAFLIYAGVMMVTAGGNEEQVTKSKKIIVYAVIGIVIILLSYAIVSFVTGALG